MKANLEELQNRLSAAVESSASQMDIVFKPMFGGVCSYVKGRVFASLSDVGLAIKLASDAQNELLELGAKRLQYEPDAPVSKQYIVVPPAFVNETDKLAFWMAKSVDFVLSQPAPKSKRK